MSARARVLFLASNPLPDAPVAVDVEARGILDRIERSGAQDRLELVFVPAPRVTDLLRVAERHRPAIVHVTGHGNTKELYFLGEDDTPTTLSVRAITDVMRQLGQDEARIVVLNYCASSEAARAIASDPKGRIACAVGTLSAIPDAEAIAFAGAFYGALAAGLSVQRAFEDGKVQVGLVGGKPDRIELAVRPGVDASALVLGREEAPSARNMLRAPPADFTGRSKEMAEVLGKRGAAGVLVSGQGGVGKTALALKLAAGLAQSYPDAQLDIPLRGSSGAPLTAETAMADVIHAFDPTSKLPAEPGAIAGLYRATLHGKRALLVLDDAKDAAHIEPLLPPEGSFVVVTAWSWLVAPGIEPYDLGEMTPDDATALVRRIASRLSESEAAELAARCGHVPLALRAAAGTLAMRRDLKPARYLERLRSADERVKLIEGVLREGAAMLDLATRDAWTMLGVFVADFEVEAVAAVLDVDGDRASDLLSEILQRNLIEWDEPSDRYRLHDLVREYVRRDITESAAQSAGMRFAEHFAGVAMRADDRVAEGGDAMLEGLATFDRERRNIAAALAWTMDRAGADARVASLLVHVLCGSAYSLALREQASDRASWFAAAARLAKQSGDLAMAALLLGNQGAAQMELGDVFLASKTHEEELEIAHKIAASGDAGGPRAVAIALGNAGVARWATGRPEEALACFEEQLATARTIGDRRIEAGALGNLGNAAWGQGDIEKATALYRERLSIAREIGDKRAEGTALGNLASVLFEAGNSDEALPLYEQRLAIAMAIGDRRGEGAALGNMGVARKARGETAQAIELLLQHLAIAEQLGDERAKRHAIHHLAEAYGAAGDDTKRHEYAVRLLGRLTPSDDATARAWNGGDGELPPPTLLAQVAFGGGRAMSAGPTFGGR